VLTQTLLQNEKFGVIEGQYWLAPASFISLFTLSILTGEMTTAIAEDHFSTIVMNNKELFVGSALLGIVVRRP
jgi:hypothetical protein